MHLDYDLLGKVLRSLHGTQCDLDLQRQELLELRKTVDRQAAEIAWLKAANACHERNQTLLFAYVQDEFARVLLWVGAIAGKVLPKAASLANELAAKFGQAQTIPPYRLRTGVRGKIP